MATGTAETTPIPPPIQASPSARFERYIEQQLDKTRSQVKLVDFFSSLMLLAAGVLGFLLATALVDAWVFDLGFFGRAVALLALVGGTGWFVASRVLPLVLRKINPAYAARVIEQAQPSLKNSLINFWLLRTNRAGVHDLVYQAVEEQAATDLQHVPVDSTVDRSRLIHLGYVLAGVVVVCALYKVFSPKDPLQTVARVLAPWSGVSRPSRVEIDEVQPGDSKVFHGQTIKVSARVTGARSSDHVTLIFSTVDGQITERIVALKAATDGLHYEGVLSPGSGGIQQDILYRVAVFDRGVSESQLASASPVAETEQFHLAVMPAPTITVQSVQYVYPSYTKRLTPPVSKQADLEALEGTKVTISATANLPIKSAYLEFDPQPPQSDKAEKDSSTRASQVLPMQADGQEARCTFVLELAADRTTPKYSSYQLRFITTEGHQNEQPILHRIAVLRDLPPEIEIVVPKDERIEVPEDGKQTIEIRALDPDFALSKISLRAVVAGSDLLDKSLLGASASGRGQAVVSYEFKPAELSLVEGDEVVYWGVAADNRTAPRTGLPDPNTERTRNYHIKITAPREKPANKPDPEKNPADGEKEPKPGDDPQEKPGDMPPRDGAKNNPPQGGEPQEGSKENEPKAGETQGKKKLGDKYDGGDQAKTDSVNGSEGGKPGGNSAGAKAPGDKSGNQSQGEKTNDKAEGDKTGDKSSDKSGDKSEGGTSGEKSGDKSQGEKTPSGNSGGASGDKSEQQSGDKSAGGGNSGQQTGDKQGGDKTQGGNSQGGGKEGGEPGAQQNEGGGDYNGGKAGQGANRRPGGTGGKDSQAGEPGEGSQAEKREGPLHEGEVIERVNEHLKEQAQKQGGQSGQKQPGDKQPGGAQTGDKQPGGAQSGDKQAGDKQPGDKQPGGAQSGDKQPGDKQPGGGQSGDKQPGGKQPGEKQPGGGTSGQQPQKPGEAASGNEGGNPQGGSETKPEQGGGKKEGQSPAGGEGQNGQSGAGQKTENQGGSPAAGQDSKDRDKKQGDKSGGGGDKQGDESKSPGQSKKQSDSKGGEGGEQQGGGKEGGGQGAKQAGNDSAGGNSPGDQGNGKAEEPGAGQTSGKGGKGPISDKPTGVSGSQEGEGTGTQSGGKEPGSGQPGKNTSGQKQPGQEGKKPGDKQPTPGEGGKEPGGTGRPGDSQGKNSGSSIGGGGQMNDAKNGPNLPEELPVEEKANLEYARKATDLALEHLRDQKDNPDPELLNKLGMTKEELAKFVARWESLKKAAAKDDPLGKRDLDESLKSLGLRSSKDKVRGGAGKKDDTKGLLDQGPRSEPPPSYLEQFNAFKRGTARAEK